VIILSRLRDRKEYSGQVLGTDENGETRLIRTNEHGNLVVSTPVNVGSGSITGIFGAQLTANRHLYSSLNFSTKVDTRVMLDKSTASGSLSYIDSKLSVASGASTSSSGVFETKRTLRYKASKSFECMFTARFTAPEVGNTRSIGLFNEMTGFAVRMIDNELNFSLKRDNSWIINIPQSDWEGDIFDGTGYSGVTLDASNLAIYRLSGGYLGVAPLTLEVYAGKGLGFVEAHTMDFSNSRTNTHFNSPYLPFRVESINTTATGDNLIESGSAGISSFSNEDDPHEADDSSREFPIDTGLTTIAQNVEAVVGVFHNMVEYNGNPNGVVSRLLSVTATTDGDKTVVFSIKKLKTPPTGGTWSPVDADNSIIEQGIGTTVTQLQLDNAEPLFLGALAKVDSLRDYVGNLGIELYPDEYVVLTMESNKTSDVRVIIRESERF